MKIQSLLRFLVVLLLALPPAASPQVFNFDPVNDDTDIFLFNPNLTANRPNVLIILDNTANWNNAFTNEKNALVQVVNGLTDVFNLGLMMFPETGGGNDSIDGGYVRFHSRPMNDQNRAALASQVLNLDKNNDKGNNATTGLALYEAYLYFAGETSRAGHGKVKTDKDGTTDPILSPLTGHALPAGTSPALYRSPIADDCQRSFIIYISNGPAAENAAARTELEGFLATLTGTTPPATIGITPSGLQSNWADEMAKFMANADVNAANDGVQNVFTYVVEVDPGLTGQGPDMTALMQSVASNGKGKYFGVHSTASGTAIVDALNDILTEVQAINSVFASTTLPVSVNVRGTNLNQVYIGMFRPDENKSPRWLGNLKLYNLALNSATGEVFLADASNGPPPAVGDAAENPTTGFVSANATSFWTTSSNYWAFRDPSQNGAGGASDRPDGDLVEKGGAAQQVRTLFPLAEGTTPKRRLYTCTDGGTFTSQCTPGSLLSATPFADNNTDIDAGSLQLETRLVSPLTGLDTKAVTALTDRRAAILSNADPATLVSVTALSNGAATGTITNLTTSTPQPVTTLTAEVSGIITVSLASIVKVGNVYRVTTNQPLSGVVAGSTVLDIGCTSGNTNDFNTLSAAARTVSPVESTQSFLIPGPSGNKTCNSGSVNGPGTTNSTTAVATVASHGFVSGQPVTITGATPVQFNGTFNITKIDDDNFRYTISSEAGAASPNPTITAAGNTTTATATTSAAHGFLVNTPVTITGASPSQYNGTFNITEVPDATSFKYSVPFAIGPNTASPVYAIQGGGTTVTATAPGHTFVGGSVTISGSDIGDYNGTFPISNVVPGTSFDYTPTATVLPANSSGSVTASAATVPTVTATVANHGFNPGDPVIIEGGSEALHTSSGAGLPGGFTILTVPDANTFTYSNPQAVAPAGSYTARPPTLSTRAIATVTAHGLTAGAEVIIAGATPTGYNGTQTVTRVVDANTFEYALTSEQGPNTSTTVTASVKTTTARATSVGHGFATGNTVVISGATPAVFNGTFTITVLDPSTFTYAIATPEGDATGTVTAVASGASSTERTALINWVRGEDNFSDENSDASNADIRASAHGDVLHSRPAVINFNRFGSDNDVFVFYGANDGVFHAVRGGYAADAGDPSGLAPGHEAWGFVAPEHFGQFQRMRTNSPVISSSFKKPYFMDGPIGVHTRDADDNGRFGDAGDTVNLYVAMRRGGRFLYALDVNTPTDPRYLWKITNGTPEFTELGQTWSNPVVVEGLAGLADPVLVFGAGYDPNVEDIPPSAIISASATSVTTAAGTFNRTMGRGLFVVNALTGARVWSAGAPGSGATLEVAGMDCAIPADVTVVKNESGGPVNRAYAGDTCGNVWRFDFSGANLSTSTVTKIAAVGNFSSPSTMRKFLHAPDVVGQQGYDAVLIGSGDREHPFDTTVVNRMYMFKDTGGDTGPVTGTTGTSAPNPTLTESLLTDVTSNCIQDAAGCAPGVTQTDFAAQLAASDGWFLTLGAGEKVIGNVVSLAGTTFFNTNQPSATAGGGTCGGNLGIARQYQVSTVDASATTDINAVGGLTGADRSLIHAGGGYLPSPVHVVVVLDGKPVEAVISGIQVSQPAGATLSARLRRYWYREIDQ